MVLQYNSEILGKSISAVPHGPVHSSVFTTLGNSQGTYPTNSVVPDTGVTGARCPGCDNICCRLLGDKAACAVPLMKQTASSIFLILVTDAADWCHPRGTFLDCLGGGFQVEEYGLQSIGIPRVGYCI